MKTNPFDQRLQNAPKSWRLALVNVIDTAESVCIGLQNGEFGVNNPCVECPGLVSELTKMTIELYNSFEGEGNDG